MLRHLQSVSAVCRDILTSSGLIFEGVRRIIQRDKVGFGVMIFADNVFKYTSNMVKHIPGLADGTQV